MVEPFFGSGLAQECSVTACHAGEIISAVRFYLRC